MAVDYFALATEQARAYVQQQEPTIRTLFVVRRQSDGFYWREVGNVWTACLKRATTFYPESEAIVAMQERTSLDRSAWTVVPIDVAEL